MSQTLQLADVLNSLDPVLAQVELLEVPEVVDVFNDLNLVLLQRQLFEQLALVQALDFDYVVVHQVELSKVGEQV